MTQTKEVKVQEGHKKRGPPKLDEWDGGKKVGFQRGKWKYIYHHEPSPGTHRLPGAHWC